MADQYGRQMMKTSFSLFSNNPNNAFTIQQVNSSQLLNPDLYTFIDIYGMAVEVKLKQLCNFINTKNIYNIYCETHYGGKPQNH